MTISGMYALAKGFAGSVTKGKAAGARRNWSTRGAFLAVLALVVVMVASCGKGTPPIITVQISPNATQNVEQGQSLALTATLGNDVNGAGVTWTLTGTSCAGATCGTLTNQTKTSVTYVAPTGATVALTVTLTATSVTDTVATSTVTINVPLAPQFGTTCPVPAGTAPQVLPNGSNGVPYVQVIDACGGIAPLTFQVTQGALPQGLTLNSTGTITGRPSSSGTSSFSVTLADSGTPPLTATQAFSITIAPPPPLSITTTSLATAYVGIPYNAKIASTGGVPPLTWTIVPGSGSLPPGLNLSAAGGAISGIPTTTGTFTFTAQVQDMTLPTSQVKPQPLSITVAAVTPLAITTTSLPGGTVATGYSHSLQASGGIAPYTWTLKTGLLPAGLSLNSTGGISGTPNLIGNASFTVQVSDSEPTPQILTQTLGIAVGAGAASSNLLLNGQYAFLFNGFDQNGSVVIAGTMTFNGQGNIAGIESSNRLSSNGAPEPLPAIGFTGTYLMNSGASADGRGAMQIIATSPIGNSTLTTDYQLALDSSGNVHFIENDTTGTTGSGILKPMLGSSFTASSFSGNYAFEFAGLDSNGKRAVLAGMLNANASETLTSNGQGPNADFNDAGTFDAGGGPLTLSGNFQMLTASSGAVALVVPLKPADTWSFIFYFVSPDDLFLINVGRPRNLSQTPPPPRLSGEMILQQPGYQFTTSSLAGVTPPATTGTSVVTGTGLTGSSSSVFAGLLSSTACDGQSAVTLSYDQNEGGAFTGPVTAPAEACTIGSNGRVAFTAPGGGALQSKAAVAYLTGPGQGFLIGNDADATGGLLERQSPNFSSFADPAFAGGYTLSTAVAPDNLAAYLTGQLVAGANAGSPTFTGTLDEVTPPSTPNLGEGLAAPYSVAANGRGTMTSNSPAGFPTNSVFYVVAPGTIRIISADPSAQPEVIFLDH